MPYAARTKKPATGFPARALFLNSCDDEDMPVICPTCQIPQRAEIILADFSYSRPCTGGNLVAAIGAEDLPAGGSEGLAGGGVATLPVVCTSGVALVCEVRCTRARDAERRTPQEREIEGPAL
jgi:hypothetical protein